MPRGARAVRGYERDGSYDHHGDGGSATTLISPVADKLVGVCWCGRTYLLLDQRDVLDLITYSCDKSWCLDPDGNYIRGEIVTVYGQHRTGRDGDKFERLTIENAKIVLAEVIPLRPTRQITPTIKHEMRTQGLDLALRREDVRHYWQQGKSAKAIKHLLGLAAVHTVYDDLTWLRKKGRLV